MKNKYFNLAITGLLTSAILDNPYGVKYFSSTKHKQASKQYKNKNANIEYYTDEKGNIKRKVKRND